MAEAVGIALSAVVLVKPILKAIHDTFLDAKRFGKDAEQLLLRFSVQEARLESIECILFEQGKFPSVPGRVFDQFPSQMQELVVRMLRQLYGLLLDFNTTNDKYNSGRDRVGWAANASSADRNHLSTSVIAYGEESEKSFEDSKSWTKKAWWVMWDKRNTEKMIVEFESWTERFQLLIDSAWWSLASFSTIEQMNALEVDRDAAQAGLANGVGLRKLLIDDPDSISKVIVQMESTLGQFQRQSMFQDLEIGVLNNQKVIMEYRTYGTDETGYMSGPTSMRIKQLAALLHEHKDCRFKVPRCINYFDDVPRHRVGFAFQLPSFSLAEPESLYMLFAMRRQRPSLDARLQLAYELSESLLLLHSVGWVHKSIRSENVLFFPESDVDIAEPEIATGRADREISLSQPQILGFEYSRQESDSSNLKADYDPARNLYRHPERWGQPKEKFSMIHDIYALGVMLLEIGLWERVDSLDKGALLNLQPPDPYAVKRRLVKHASQRLGFYAGERYKQVVIRCLNGSFANDTVQVTTAVSTDLGVKLGLMLQVVDVLSACRLAHGSSEGN